VLVVVIVKADSVTVTVAESIQHVSFWSQPILHSSRGGIITKLQHVKTYLDHALQSHEEEQVHRVAGNKQLRRLHFCQKDFPVLN